MNTPTEQVTRPLRRLAQASVTTCATPASAYGRCILATYTDVKKDICADEFKQFKDCLSKTMKRKW
ncbi:hypothetical protein PLICRDRAFT_172651 [Plicaturopsis crispa FD-325 SS-3]|nr:hypothetical protein PLICRDRAFT_172651 [Plicaturopsis crispa FD-325 SS-3]